MLREYAHRLFVLVPLVLLTVDFVRIPVLSHRCEGTTEPQMARLIEKQYEPLGSYLGHGFFMSLDSILDSGYLNYLNGKPAALVLGIDHEDPNTPKWGGLMRTALKKLDALSAADAQNLRRLISGAEPASGKVVELQLQLAKDAYQSFPVNRLYVIGIKSQAAGTNDEQSMKYLKDALRDVMARAAQSKEPNLVIPSVGVAPGDSSTMQFREFYPIVLQSAVPARNPLNVYVSIYQDWPSGYRKQAFNSLRDAWRGSCAGNEKDPFFIHQNLRLVLIGAFVCLVVSSFYTRLSLKNFVIIFFSFIAVAYGALASADTVVNDWSAAGKLALDLALVGFLALMFPLLPWWNPREIFGQKE